MSFGYSIGDFITLSLLALNIYDSCKNSPTEFKSITSEVNTLSLILKSIASHLSHHSVDTEAAKELESLCFQTSKVLEEIRGLLEKYGSLGQRKPRKLDRIRWALKKSSADVQNKLLFHAGVLNYLNTSLTKLSHDRLEQNLSMLLKKVTEDATTPSQNPSNRGPLPQLPTLHHPLPLRMARLPDTPLSGTPVSVATCDTADVLTQELEKSASQSDNDEDSDFLRYNSSELPLAAEGKVKPTDGQEQLTHAGSLYQRLRANGNSFQINGDMGESALLPHRSNTYVDVIAAGKSIQFNGNVLDPTKLLNAIRC